MSREPTVATTVAAYLRHLERQAKADKFSADHLSNIRRDLTRFEAFVGGAKLVHECRQHDLSSWVEENPQWKSVCSQRNSCASVTGCFRWAEEEELIDRAPYRTPRAIRGATAKPRRPATTHEYLELIRHGSKQLREPLFFLRETGARTCEMREVIWTDITFGDQPCIVLFAHKTARKTGKGRTIALNKVVAKFLLWMQRSSRSEHVFVSTDGTPWDRSSFARHLRRTALRIGLDEGVIDRVSGYCLRHTFTVSALTSGFTSKEVADQLGHSDCKMVERVYGSHTVQNLAYLSRVADDIRQRRA